MILATAIEGSASLVAQVVSPAVRALVLGAGAGLGLAAFRVKSTSARLFTWTAVLYAALAMPFLGRMLPPVSVPTPAFLTRRSQPIETAATPSVSDVSVTRTSIPKRTPSPGAPRTISSLSVTTEVPPRAIPGAAAVATGSRSIRWPSIRWSTVATGIYFAVALILLVRFVVGLIFSRRLKCASQEIRDPRVTRKLISRADAGGLDFIPQVAESEIISVPVTMGVLRSTILLPTSWREWDDAKLDAVIAHEASHVARRDALTQRLSLLHRAIFWFSPLAWWLDRHLADLAEQASDDAALACGANRNEYARTLLGFFEALHAAPGRVWWQGVSMAKAGQAEQRLERILAWRGSVAMNLRKSIAVAIIALALPVVYLAASIRPGNPTQESRPSAPPATPSTPPVAADAPTPPDAPPATIVVSSGETYSVVPPPAPAAPVIVASKAGHVVIRPVVPLAPVPPMPAVQSHHSGSSHGKGYSYAFRGDDEQRFVIVTGNSDSLTMSGSSEDARHVEKLRKQISGDFIWFQRDEKSYIIRDQSTVDRARKLWAPEEELGKKQEELGKQQEALGEQQEELGSQMEKVHVKVPDITAELDKLKAKLQKLGSTATMGQIGDLQSEIGELQSKIGEIQSSAGEEQSKLGEQMGALGEKQGKLGEQQGELGREQGELAEKASREMKEILDEAIKKGTAQPEPETGGTASL